LFISNSFGQTKYAPKDFYLIDSLDLSTLPPKNIIIIDSLLSIYHNTNSDSLKWVAINNIVENTNDKCWVKYQKIANSITDASLKKNPNSTFLYKSKSTDLNNTAYALSKEGKITEAIAKYEEAIVYVKKSGDLTELPTQLNNLAGAYYKINNITKALEKYEESYLIAKKEKDPHTAQILANIAMVYNNLGQPDEAEKLLKEALSIHRKEDNKMQEALILSDIATIEENKKNYDKAIFFYKQSTELALDINDKYRVSSNYNDIAECLLQKDTAEALVYIKKGRALDLELKNKRGLSESAFFLADIHFVQKKMDSALFYATKAYTYSKEVSYNKVYSGSSILLSKIYISKKDYKSALKYFRIYHTLIVKNTDNQALKKLAKTEARIAFEKEKEINELKHKKDIAIKEKEKEKQEIYTKTAVAGSLILGIVALTIFKQLKTTRKQKKIIEYSKKEIQEKSKEITDSIIYTKRIQNAILPPTIDIKTHLPNSFILYQPKDIISGDFYWLETMDNFVLFAVADCTGHGVPGAMVSIICNNGLNRSVREYGIKHPSKILDKTKEIVIKEFEKSGENINDGMDITLIAINKEKNILSFAGAQNSLLIIRKNTTPFNEQGENTKLHQYKNYSVLEIKGDKQPVGNFSKSFPFRQHNIKIIKGDTIYLFTDGFADQFGGERNKKLKIKNLRDFLVDIQTKEMDEQKESLASYFEKWKGEHEQVDDVCIAGIRV